MKFSPIIDKDFYPIELALRDFEKEVASTCDSTPITICVERNDGYNYIYNTNVFHENSGRDEENYRIVERMVKSILWLVGGYKIIVSGSKKIFERLAKDYAKGFS